MAYIDNPFKVGQTVVCIRDCFPRIITTGQDKSGLGKIPDVHPKREEVLVIDEILGEYLRFDKYDCYDETHPDFGWRWWKHTAFAPIQEKQVDVLSGVAEELTSV